VATPATAATVVVPESVAPLVPLPALIVSVTFPVKLVTVWPEASRVVTSTEGAITVPALAALGCTVKASWVGTDAMMSKALLTAASTPGEVAARV